MRRWVFWGRVGLGGAFLVAFVFIVVVTVVLTTFMYLYINGHRQTYNVHKNVIPLRSEHGLCPSSHEFID